MTTYCAPTLHVYVTFRVFGSSGHRAKKKVNVLCIYTIFLLSGATKSFFSAFPAPTQFCNIIENSSNTLCSYTPGDF